MSLIRTSPFIGGFFDTFFDISGVIEITWLRRVQPEIVSIYSVELKKLR